MKKEWGAFLFAVVFMFSSIDPVQSEGRSDATVEIKGFSYHPASLNVTAGTAVTWINLDPSPHTVTADDGSFDSGSIPGDGGSFDLVMAEPGIFHYYCTPHPSMRGEVIVSQAEISNPETYVRPKVKVEVVAEGFTAPMGFVTARDGTGRMFLVDQVGLVKIVYLNGTVLEEPFLDLRDRMIELWPEYDERGLLGLAFHPEFSENGRVFVFYTGPLRPGAPEGWDSTNRLSEFTISDDDPNRVDMGSERVLLYVDKPQFNHNGGTIEFGPEGYLYVPLGDGGGANDVGVGHPPDGNGQNTTTLLGKILRIDVDGTGDGAAYGIPADNPFVDDEDTLPEIYAFGFRNPWRITFDAGGHRSLLVSDAGQDLWEEVNLVIKGGNYGWRIREGTHCFDPDDPRRPPATCPDVDARGGPLIDPVIEYGHDLGTSVVGGHVYRGEELPDMVGRYIFADWSNDFSKGNGTLLAATPSLEGLWVLEEVEIADRPSGRLDLFIRSFGVDDEGELYVLTSDSLGPAGSGGAVFRILPAESRDDTAADEVGLGGMGAGGEAGATLSDEEIVAVRASGGWAPDGVISEGEYSRSLSLSGGDFVVHWSNDDETLRMGLTGRAEGFVAIGFEPTQGMKDADMIMGWVSRGKVTVLDLYSTGVYGPHPPDEELGGTDDILDLGGSEVGGWTVIEFERKMDTGDRFDKPFRPGETVNIIWSMSSPDSLDIRHNLGKGSGRIAFEGSGA